MLETILKELDSEFWDGLAIDAYLYLLDMDENNPLLLNNLGLAYIRTDQSTKAIRALRKAARCDAGYTDPCYHLSRLYLELGKVRQAKEYRTEYEKRALAGLTKPKKRR